MSTPTPSNDDTRIHSGGPGEQLPPPSSPDTRDPDLTYDDSTHNEDEES